MIFFEFDFVEEFFANNLTSGHQEKFMTNFNRSTVLQYYWSYPVMESDQDIFEMANNDQQHQEQQFETISDSEVEEFLNTMVLAFVQDPIDYFLSSFMENEMLLIMQEFEENGKISYLCNSPPTHNKKRILRSINISLTKR